MGYGTVVKRGHAEPGVDLTYIKLTGESNGDGGDQYAGLDRFGRIVDQRWTTSGGTAKDRWAYGHDRNSNRLYKENLVDSARSELYGYDNLNQLTSMQRGTLNETKTGLTGAASRSQSQLLEERVGSVVKGSYVWSPVYVDAMVARDRDTDGNGTLDERLYAVHDANFNVTALIDTSGTVVERYAYDAFGLVTILTPAWATRTTSSYAWVYLHQGGRWDADAGTYSFRHREYSPTLGRWTTNDPIGFGGGDANWVRYVGNNGVNAVDPSGREPSGGANAYAERMVIILYYADPEWYKCAEMWIAEYEKQRTKYTWKNQVNEFGLMCEMRNLGKESLRQKCKDHIRAQQLPSALKGRWQVCLRSIPAGRFTTQPGHSWIYFRNTKTGEEHTISKGMAGYGAAIDENGRPISGTQYQQTGIQSDRDLKLTKGYRERCKTVTDPVIDRTDAPQYNWYFGPNCASYARDTWYKITGEYFYFIPPPFSNTPDVLWRAIGESNRDDVRNEIKRESFYDPRRLDDY